MAIVKMARAQLTAFASEREQLLHKLQELENVHFSDLSSELNGDDYEDILDADQANLELAAVQEEINRIDTAIRGLEEIAPPKGLMASLNSALPKIPYSEFEQRGRELDVTNIYQEVRKNLNQLSNNEETIAQQRELRRQLIPYQKIDVSLNRMNDLSMVDYSVGSIPKRGDTDFRRELAQLEETYVEGLYSDDKQIHFFILHSLDDGPAVQEILRRYGFTPKNLDSDASVPEQMENSEKLIEKLESDNQVALKELHRLAGEPLDDLKLKMEWLRNEEVQLKARERFVKGNHVFLLEMYFPVTKQADVEEALAKTLQEPYDLQVKTIERSDAEAETVPILLENNAIVKPFENVIELFSMPKYNELDPTPVVAPWFAMCFGTMLGDMGYGLVLFVISTIALQFFKLKEGMNMQMRFLQLLSIPSIIIGGIFGSFFSMPIPGLISPTDQPNDILMVSLIYGVIMLFFALGVKGYMCIRDGDWLAFFVDVISWYMFVIGAGILLFGDNFGIGPIGKKIAMAVMIAGLVLVLLFSARDEEGTGARIAWGAYNVYGATSWIGDIVSFARLAALAMSGGFIGSAINMIAGNLAKSVPGFVVALVIILIFHPFNLFLSGLSAYVHTLRLIYVEFFGQFYEGGGVPFKRFRADSEYIDVQ